MRLRKDIVNAMAQRHLHRPRCPYCLRRTVFGHYGRSIAFACRSCLMRFSVERRVRGRGVRFIVTGVRRRREET